MSNAKLIVPIYQIFNGASMTGTTVLTSPVTNIQYKDSVSYSFNWTGTPVGTFSVQGSIDYNPGLPQSDGSANNGTWVTVPIVDQSNNPITASGQAGSNLLDLYAFAFPWIRVIYTNSSGTGSLNGWISGKAF